MRAGAAKFRSESCNWHFEKPFLMNRIHSKFAMGIVLWFSFTLCSIAAATLSWPAALAQMPLGTATTELNRTNCVPTLLQAFRSNDLVKALIFMPGATDEFYMFRRARASLTNSGPTLLDAVRALTNQTFIRVTFLPPLLLLHTDEDPLEPLITFEYPPLAEKMKQTR